MPNWGNLFGGNDGRGFEWDKLAEIMGNVDNSDPLGQIQLSNIRRIFDPPMGNDMPQQGGITGQPLVSREDGIRLGEIAQREREQAQLPMPQANMTGIDQFAQKPLPNVISQEDIGSQAEGFIPPEIDYHKRMLELYKPETQDSDRLEAIIGRMPQRNKPGVMRKIAAALSGLTGDLRVVDRSLYGPYYNQMADWKNEYEPAKDLAQEERYSNNNARMLANSMLTQEMSDRRLQATLARHKVLETNSDRRLDQGDTKINQGQQRINLAEKGFQLKEKLAQGGSIVKTDDGKVYLMNRMGELEELPLDNLSFEEKEIVKANQSIRAAKEKPKSSSNQRDRLQLKVNADGSHTVINLDKEVATPVKTGTGEESKASVTELDKNRKLTANAMKVKNEHPEWSKWIQFDKSGRFTGIKDKSWLGDTATWNKIYQAIYGSPSKTVFESAKDAEAKKAKPPAGAEGKVHIRIKATGQTAWASPDNPKIKSGEYERIP